MQSASLFYDTAIVKEESEPHTVDKSQATFITNVNGRKGSLNDISACESSFETVLPDSNDQNWWNEYLDIKMKTMEEEIERRVCEHLNLQRRGKSDGLQDVKEDPNAQSEAHLQINQKIAALEKSCVELGRKQRKHQMAFGDVRTNAVLLKDILSGIIRLVDSLGAAAEPHIKNHNRLITRVACVEKCLSDAGILKNDKDDGVTVNRRSPRSHKSLSAVLPAEDFQLSCIELEEQVRRMSRDGGLLLDSLHSADDSESRASSNLDDFTPRSSSTNPSKSQQEGGSSAGSPSRAGRHACFSTDNLHEEIEIEQDNPEEQVVDFEMGQLPISSSEGDLVDEEQTSSTAQQPQKELHRAVRLPPFNSVAVPRPSSPALPGSARIQPRNNAGTQPSVLTAAPLPQNSGSAVVSNVCSKPQLKNGVMSAPQSPVCASRKQTDSLLEEAFGVHNSVGARQLHSIPTWAQPVIGTTTNRIVEDVAKRAICLSASLPTVMSSGASPPGSLHGSMRIGIVTGSGKGSGNVTPMTAHQEAPRAPSSRSISPNGARTQQTIAVPAQTISTRCPSSRSISPNGARAQQTIAVPPQSISRANALGTGTYSPRSSMPYKIRAAVTNSPPASNQFPVGVPTPRTRSPAPVIVPPPTNQLVGVPTPRARSPTNVAK